MAETTNDMHSNGRWLIPNQNVALYSIVRPNLQSRETKLSGANGERKKSHTFFLFSADREQDWQPYPIDLYSATYIIIDDHTTLQLDELILCAA